MWARKSCSVESLMVEEAIFCHVVHVPAMLVEGTDTCWRGGGGDSSHRWKNSGKVHAWNTLGAKKNIVRKQPGSRKCKNTIKIWPFLNKELKSSQCQTMLETEYHNFSNFSEWKAQPLTSLSWFELHWLHFFLFCRSCLHSESVENSKCSLSSFCH